MSGDILLKDGDLPHFWKRNFDRDTSIEQRVKIRLLTHRGEWLLDSEAGFPYDDITDPDFLSALIQADLRQISEVVYSRISIAVVDAVYRITAEIQLTGGKSLTVEV